MNLYKALLLTLFLSGCAAIGGYQLNNLYGKEKPRERLVSNTSAAGMNYHENIKPILNGRCVVCHGCYDAPCQLKLDSSAGIERGASKDVVYNGQRLLASKPTRLFVDAHGTQAWRNKDFFPVLNERRQEAHANLDSSLLFQSLALKYQQGPSEHTLLPDDYDVSIKRNNECPSVEEFPRFAKKNPSAGMPYGLPALPTQEYKTLTQWLSLGAALPEPQALDQEHQQRVSKWERFLNQDDKKSQLVSRYIYEHWFLANLYFDQIDRPAASTPYFKLVRSFTPPGQAIKIVSTRRPYGDPQAERIYYRLQIEQSSLITKTHLPYALNPERMQWVEELFFKPNYTVTELPAYNKDSAPNPFVTFRELPARSRYRFMLEESEHIIMGFIKGPVCRGQVAVDVINDHFWVFFVEPDGKALPMLDEFLDAQSNSLVLPGQDGSNAGLLAHWTKYSGANRDYLNAKKKALDAVLDKDRELNLDLIWNGDGHNPNAALTIFRNFDNAVVVKGLVGEAPKTAWVIDYPLLERIHYLLTVDFDVFGNIGHQLNTRLYMDFLRIEGEFNFLTLLPQPTRYKLRNYWYRNASEKVKEHLYSCDSYINGHAPAINYSTTNPKLELYDKLKQHIAPALNHSYDIASAPADYLDSLNKIASVQGIPASLLPESTVLLIKDKKHGPQLFTVLGNKAHSNITSLLKEHKNRLPEEDSLTVAYGIIGDYPNAFWSIDSEELTALAQHIGQLQSEDDYFKLLSEYGVRRTSPDFWAHSDLLHKTYQQQQPRVAGLMDYNRIENR